MREIAAESARSKRSVALALGGFVLVAGIVAFAPRAQEAAAQGADQERPNVVVVMTDDQRADEVRVMPTVQRQLADQGTTFENFFATFPLCCPSRATFLTGQYSHNHGVGRGGGGDLTVAGFRAFDDAGSLAISMQNGGYRTGYIGKYLNGYGADDGVPEGWTEWYGAVGKTVTHQYGYTLNQNGVLREYGTRDRDYQTDVYARKAASFIRRGAPDPQPFFLTVAPSAPHGEVRAHRSRNPRPAPRHRGSFDDAPLPSPPSFNERDVSDKPRFVRRVERLDASAREKIERRYRDRLASLLAVDDAVKAILQELREAGELDDTLVVFTSDNGYLLGEHRLTAKTVLYEESARVPLILRGPGIPTDQVRSQLAGNIDLAPTILDAAGAQSPRLMDGLSLFSLAQDPNVEKARDILLENASSSAVRTQRYVYAEHPEGEKELYDLRRDPHQLRSRHTDPAYNPIQADLADRLRTLEDCKGAECR